MADDWGDVVVNNPKPAPVAGRGRGMAVIQQGVASVKVSDDDWGTPTPAAPAAKPAFNDSWGATVAAAKPAASASDDEWGAPTAPAKPAASSNGWGSNAQSEPSSGGWGASGGSSGGARTGGGGGNRSCHKVKNHTFPSVLTVT